MSLKEVVLGLYIFQSWYTNFGTPETFFVYGQRNSGCKWLCDQLKTFFSNGISKLVDLWFQFIGHHFTVVFACDCRPFSQIMFQCRCFDIPQSSYHCFFCTRLILELLFCWQFQVFPFYILLFEYLYKVMDQGIISYDYPFEKHLLFLIVVTE